jgi:hydrogenase maturation protease
MHLSQLQVRPHLYLRRKWRRSNVLRSVRSRKAIFPCPLHGIIRNMNILVLGIGQSLRGDDAAGLAAVRLWQAQQTESAGRVRVELCELPGLGLLDLLDGMDAAILVDALQGTGRPGSLVRLGPDELAAFTPDAQSAHGWGVAETLLLGRSLYPQVALCRITLIGIFGERFNLGVELSPSVQSGLDDAVALIEKEVQALL